MTSSGTVEDWSAPSPLSLFPQPLNVLLCLPHADPPFMGCASFPPPSCGNKIVGLQRPPCDPGLRGAERTTFQPSGRVARLRCGFDPRLLVNFVDNSSVLSSDRSPIPSPSPPPGYKTARERTKDGLRQVRSSCYFDLEFFIIFFYSVASLYCQQPRAS